MLASVAAILVAADALGIVVSHLRGGYHRMSIFNVDQGGNAPAYYFAVLILLLAGLLAVVSTARRAAGERDRPYWTGLAVLALCFSVDEAVGIHDRLAEYAGRILRIPVAVWTYAWVAPYAALMIIVVVIYFRFFMSLRRRIRFLMGLAFAVYVAGAIVAESIGGYFARTMSMRSAPYQLMTTLEWALEVAGVLVAIYAVMTYIDEELGGLELRTGSSG